jgi:hypothetical protein
MLCGLTGKTHDSGSCRSRFESSQSSAAWRLGPFNKAVGERAGKLSSTPLHGTLARWINRNPVISLSEIGAALLLERPASRTSMPL